MSVHIPLLRDRLVLRDTQADILISQTTRTKVISSLEEIVILDGEMVRDSATATYLCEILVFNQVRMTARSETN